MKTISFCEYNSTLFYIKMKCVTLCHTILSCRIKENIIKKRIGMYNNILFIGNDGRVKKLIATSATDFQLHLFHEGTLHKSHELFGSHILRHRKKIVGTRFTVWAPNAKAVRVIGSFNEWNGEAHQLNKLNEQGVWSIHINENLNGHLYNYEIITQSGEVLHKADPFAFYAEVRPKTASIVYEMEGYKWKDQNWRRKKKES